MEQNNSEQQDLKELRNFIDSNPNPREQKRALAVMIWIEGIPCSKIKIILNVSAAFISRYKISFIEDGVEGLKLGHKGLKAYLSPEEHIEVIKY
jgi:putative transposase